MDLKWCQISGWEIIAKVRRCATCAANSSLKLMQDTYCRTAVYKIENNQYEKNWRNCSRFKSILLIVDMF